MTTVLLIRYMFINSCVSSKFWNAIKKATLWKCPLLKPIYKTIHRIQYNYILVVHYKGLVSCGMQQKSCTGGRFLSFFIWVRASTQDMKLRKQTKAMLCDAFTAFIYDMLTLLAFLPLGLLLCASHFMLHAKIKRYIFIWLGTKCNTVHVLLYIFLFLWRVPKYIYFLPYVCRVALTCRSLAMDSLEMISLWLRRVMKHSAWYWLCPLSNSPRINARKIFTSWKTQRNAFLHVCVQTDFIIL